MNSQYSTIYILFGALHWRHNDHDGVSNHQPYGCLLNRLFRLRSKKTSKLRVTGLCVGNSPGPVNSPHKGPVTRKMFPFDDVIMATESGYWSIKISEYYYRDNDRTIEAFETVSKMGHHCLRYWFIASSEASHFLNQYCFPYHWEKF